jgi:hypothetical protein
VLIALRDGQVDGWMEAAFFSSSSGLAAALLRWSEPAVSTL